MVDKLEACLRYTCREGYSSSIILGGLIQGIAFQLELSQHAVSFQEDLTAFHPPLRINHYHVLANKAKELAEEQTAVGVVAEFFDEL